MAYSILALSNLTELKSRRGTAANTTMATILGLNWPLVDAYSVYVWDDASTTTGNDNEVVQPSVGPVNGRWFKVDLDQMPQVNSDWNSTTGVSQILNKPTIPTVPTNVSAFTNDAGYKTSVTSTDVLNALGYSPVNPNGTSSQYVAGDGSKVPFPTLFSGSYTDLTNKPSIPAQVSLTAGTGISVTGTYPNLTIGNTAQDQVVSLTAGSGLTITGTYPNFTVNLVAPVYNNNVVRSLSNAAGTTNQFTISSSRRSFVSYTVTLSVSTPLLAGSANAQVFLEYSTDSGSTWIIVADVQNIQSVGLSVSVAITTPQNMVLCGNIPPNAIARLRPSLSGSGSVTYVRGQEVLL